MVESWHLTPFQFEELFGENSEVKTELEAIFRNILKSPIDIRRDDSYLPTRTNRLSEDQKGRICETIESWNLNDEKYYKMAETGSRNLKNMVVALASREQYFISFRFRAMAYIKKTVAAFYQVPISEIECKQSNSTSIIPKRVILYFVSTYLPTEPKTEIAKLVGREGHDGTSDDIRIVKNTMKSDPNFKRDIDQLDARFREVWANL